MKFDLEFWLTLLVGLFGGGGITAITGFLLASKKQKFDQTEALIQRLEKRIDKIELDHGECMRGRLDDKFQMGQISGQLIELRAMVSRPSVRIETDGGNSTPTFAGPQFEGALEATGDGRVEVVAVAGVHSTVAGTRPSQAAMKESL